jgi:hypothetical protein
MKAPEEIQPRAAAKGLRGARPPPLRRLCIRLSVSHLPPPLRHRGSAPPSPRPLPALRSAFAAAPPPLEGAARGGLRGGGQLAQGAAVPGRRGGRLGSTVGASRPLCRASSHPPRASASATRPCDGRDLRGARAPPQQRPSHAAARPGAPPFAAPPPSNPVDGVRRARPPPCTPGPSRHFCADQSTPIRSSRGGRGPLPALPAGPRPHGALLLSTTVVDHGRFLNRLFFAEIC